MVKKVLSEFDSFVSIFCVVLVDFVGVADSAGSLVVVVVVVAAAAASLEDGSI